MELNSVGEVIATRRLNLINDEKKEITILIGKPQQFPNSKDYYCPFQILGVRDGKVHYAGGIDAVQALQLTMDMIGSFLYTSDEAKGNKLRWEGDEEGDLGFPFPSRKTS